VKICATSSVSRLGKGLLHPRMGFSRQVDQMEAVPCRAQGFRGSAQYLSTGALFGFVGARAKRAITPRERTPAVHYLRCQPAHNRSSRKPFHPLPPHPDR
jgi:hypothetical protein